MKTRLSPVKTTLGLLILLIFSNALNLKAQKGIEIGITGRPGYTLVNFEKALGYDDEDMSDWDQFYYSVSLEGFFTSDKPLSFGAELAWQRLYYAYYIIPYGPSPVYREFNVSTTSIMGLVRYSAENKLFVLGGAGIHLFDSGVAPAIFIEPGYMVSVGEKIKIPLSVRINPVFGDGTPVPISAGIGFIYRIK